MVKWSLAIAWNYLHQTLENNGKMLNLSVTKPKLVLPVYPTTKNTMYTQQWYGFFALHCFTIFMRSTDIQPTEWIITTLNFYGEFACLVQHIHSIQKSINSSLLDYVQCDTNTSSPHLCDTFYNIFYGPLISCEILSYALWIIIKFSA